MLFVGTHMYLEQTLFLLNIVSCHVYVWHYRRGFGLNVGFIDHAYTWLGTTSHYSAIANLHT
jgi:hypothetical protein